MDDRATETVARRGGGVDLEEAAVRYASAGFHVFPLAEGAKVPKAGSRGHLDATTSVDDVRGWRRPFNVGVATGERSWFWVLDVDPRHGGDESLRSLLEEHGGGLDEYHRVRTPSGGLHFWFRKPDGAELRCSAGKIGPGLDVRGEGGYVAAPPSAVRGRGAYRWEYAPGALLLEAPTWLLELAAEARGGGRDGFAEPLARSLPEGGRHEAFVSLAGTVPRRGCDAEEVLALLRAVNARRCRPPLPERELAGIARSVCKYEPAEEDAFDLAAQFEEFVRGGTE